MKYKPIDCLGKVLNNMSPIKPYIGDKNHQSKLRFQASYKFTISFENVSNNHYISEKIFHPLLVSSIPIYWGYPRIAEHFNPACFINCHDYDSFDGVIRRVKEIDKDSQLYATYRNRQ